LERLGDLVSENVDREALLRLIDDGPPFGLPVVSHQLSAVSGQQAALGDAPHAQLAANGEVTPGSSADGWSVPDYAEKPQKLRADS
jgi:hypothetical protein